MYMLYICKHKTYSKYILLLTLQAEELPYLSNATLYQQKKDAKKVLAEKMVDHNFFKSLHNDSTPGFKQL